MSEHLSPYIEPKKDFPFLPLEQEQATLDEAITETETAVIDHIKHGQNLYRESIGEIKRYQSEKQIEVDDLTSRAKEAAAKHFYEQHLNLVALYNFWEPSVDLAIKKLSENSRGLYREFVSSLPPDSMDSSAEMVNEICQSYESFSKGSLPKDLSSFLKKYYDPFREVRTRLTQRDSSKRRTQPASKTKNTFSKLWDRIIGESLPN